MVLKKNNTTFINIKQSTINLGLILFYLFITILYVLVNFSLFKEFIYMLTPLVPVFAGYLVFRKYGYSSLLGKSIFFLSLGIFMFFLGEFFWFVYEHVLNIDPYPSVADLFYLLAYPFLFLGILKIIKLNEIKWDNLKKLFFTSIIFLSLILFIYFGLILSFDSEVPILENVIGIAYNLGDFILIISTFLVMFIIFEYKGGKQFKSWLYFLLGIISIFVADILFAIFYQEYESGIWRYTLMDLLWVLGYFCFAYSFFNMYFILKKHYSQLELLKKNKKRSK